MNARLLPLAAGFLAAFLTTLSRAEDVIVPRGAKTWGTPEFDADKWKSGPAPLGYGEPGMATTISFGSSRGEEPKDDYYAEASAALRNGDKDAAMPLLLKIDPPWDGYATFMAGRESLRLRARRAGVPPRPERKESC